MRVLLTSEARFERIPDGTIWASAAYRHAIWKRHLEVFSDVLVAARVVDVKAPSSGRVPASGPGVGFCALPSYAGLGGVVLRSRTLHAAVVRALDRCPAVIVRSPSPVAYLAARWLVGMGRPYSAQIAGDPNQVFSAGAFRHPLRVPLRHAATAAQKYVARHASAAMFVTNHVLQRKYPTRGLAYSASDVALDDSAFAGRRSGESRQSGPFTLVTVASLDQPYKGIAVLLDAVHQLRRSGHAVKLLVAGGGMLMPALQARAQQLGIESDVDFLGQLEHRGVQRALDSADVFVMPSLTEGLPRALLEAMARGLPAVATMVGGIPELLPAHCLVPPKDPAALARRLSEVLGDCAARTVMGKRNQQVAHGYHERVQAPIRRAFLLAVKAASANAQPEAACA